MSNYTFRRTSRYALSTHHVEFTKDTLTVRLTSTNTKVYDQAYGTGVAIMCQGDWFSIGVLTDNGVFLKEVDFANANANAWLVEDSGKNAFIGSDNDTDPSVAHKYDLNQCPVRLIEGTGDIMKIECPCSSSSGPCNNGCYSYGV